MIKVWTIWFFAKKISHSNFYYSKTQWIGKWKWYFPLKGINFHFHLPITIYPKCSVSVNARMFFRMSRTFHLWMFIRFFVCTVQNIILDGNSVDGSIVKKHHSMSRLSQFSRQLSRGGEVRGTKFSKKSKNSLKILQTSFKRMSIDSSAQNPHLSWEYTACTLFKHLIVIVLIIVIADEECFLWDCFSGLLKQQIVNIDNFAHVK